MNHELLFRIYSTNTNLSNASQLLDEWLDIDVGNYYIDLLVDMIFGMNENPRCIWDCLVNLKNIDKIISSPTISEKWNRRFVLFIDHISLIYPPHKLPELTLTSTPLVANLHFMETMSIMSLKHIPIIKYADDFGEGSGLFKQKLIEFGKENPDQVMLCDIESWVKMCESCNVDIDEFFTTVFGKQSFVPLDIISCDWRVVGRYTLLIELLLNGCCANTPDEIITENIEYHVLNMVSVINQNNLLDGQCSRLIEILYSVEHNKTLPLSYQPILIIYCEHPTIWETIKKDPRVIRIGLTSLNDGLRMASVDETFSRMVKSTEISEIKLLLQDLARMETHLTLLPYFVPFILDYYGSVESKSDLQLFWDDTPVIINKLGITQQILPLVEHTDLWTALL